MDLITIWIDKTNISSVMNGVNWGLYLLRSDFLKEEVGIALWAKKAFQTKDCFLCRAIHINRRKLNCT